MNIVKELREKAGMQQKELALVIGVSQPTVSDWEHQKKDPSGDRLKRLCQLFRVSPWVILCIEAPHEDNMPEDVDDELMQLRQDFRDRPDLRLLYGVLRKAPPEHIRAATAMLQALKGNADD